MEHRSRRCCRRLVVRTHGSQQPLAGRVRAFETRISSVASKRGRPQKARRARAQDADSREALLSVILPVIESLLEHHAERGDAQTCAVLARTLRPVSEKLAPKGRIRKWTLGYVEQLHRLQLFGLANAVIKQSDDERVQQLNQRSTTVTVGGGGASSSQNKPARARCSVCQLPVRGLHSWNQGCGHGGHMRCLRKWFDQGHAECPTGCGHICLLRQRSARCAQFTAASRPRNGRCDEHKHLQ